MGMQTQTLHLFLIALPVLPHLVSLPGGEKRCVLIYPTPQLSPTSSKTADSRPERPDVLLKSRSSYSKATFL